MRLQFLCCLAFIAITSAATSAAQPTPVPTGIPRSLARERAARVSDIHYELHYTLVARASATEGMESIRFNLSDASQPLLLDFRDGTIGFVDINGTDGAPHLENGHLIIPSHLLRKGTNSIQIAFSANIAAAEKAITRFEDKDDGSEYIYTLFVPMDAEHGLPLLRPARPQSPLPPHRDDHPTDWTVISNTGIVENRKFAAGQYASPSSPKPSPSPPTSSPSPPAPSHRINNQPGLPGLYVRKSKLKHAETEGPAVQKIAAAGIDYLAKYFAQPFPFPKYDMVLIPGFAYGGMEHAGATFLREESVLFRSAPTESNRFSRDILVLHELTHQWFGDFITMRWFDDLWLKEGFAQYMAYKCLAAPPAPTTPWKRFYQAIKPAAYAIDETQGTTPIYQDIPNLKDAKSAYGAIVYNKAPAVIKQLHFVLGDDAFRKGLQTYLATHRYGNAEWSDLVHALELSSHKDLQPWSSMWIKHPGMPVVETKVQCHSPDQGLGPYLNDIVLTQHSALGGDDIWPIATEIIGVMPDGGTIKSESRSRKPLSLIPARPRQAHRLPRLHLRQ